MIDDENLIYEDNRSLRFMMRISVVLCILIVVLNVILPLTGSFVSPDVFNVLDSVFWVYGMLGSLGYFKTAISKEGNRIEYKTPIPIVQVGLTRLLQFLYHTVVRRGNMSFSIFGILLLADFVYLVLLLLDKSSYYYESVEHEAQDYSITIEEDSSDSEF